MTAEENWKTGIEISGGRLAATRKIAAALNAKDAEIERLHAVLKPFADAVYNDNGSMTVTPASYDAYVKVYFMMRAVTPTRKD